MNVDDLRVEVFRAGLSGWNTVRVTHLPTGQTAECGEHRSQLRNRVAALAMLRRALGEPDPDEMVTVMLRLPRYELERLAGYQVDQ